MCVSYLLALIYQYILIYIAYLAILPSTGDGMETFIQTMGALNDATRIQILRFIDKNKEVCVCDIENAFNMIQSRISRHLKILKDAGFLKVDRRGRWAYYSIRTPLDEFRQSILKEIAHLNLDTPKLPKECKA
jgi:ArsR family transcriptional regulator